MMRAAVLTGLIATGLLLTSSAGTSLAAGLTSIADIIATPATYADTQVTVTGTVTNQTIGYGGESLYTIRGDERVITVLSHDDAPAVGSSLQVTATVILRPPDEEFTFPPILVESSRAVL
jgi:hypothetical protein